jgi:hypothetical protein
MRKSSSALAGHGVPGQINTFILDVDSEITSFGKHNRLLVFLDPQTGHIEIREDDIGLPSSSEEDRRKVANSSSQRMHPKSTKLSFLRSELSHSSTSIWHFYAIESIFRKVGFA